MCVRMVGTWLDGHGQCGIAFLACMLVRQAAAFVIDTTRTRILYLCVLDN